MPDVRRRLVAITAAASAVVSAVLISPGAQARELAGSRAVGPAPRWRIAATFSESRFRNLLTVTATGTDDAWAFGDHPHHGPIAVHWNGRTWSGIRVPGMGARPDSVSATSRFNVWAAGSRCYGGPPGSFVNNVYVSRWNGRRWASRSFSFCPSGSVVTTGPSNTWLFNDPTRPFHGFRALHFTGRWHSVWFGKAQVFSAVAAGRTVWAFGCGLARYRCFAVRWNGRDWRAGALPSPRVPPGGSFGVSPYDAAVALNPADIWVLGQISSGTSVLWHWNGTAWRLVAVPPNIDAFGGPAPDGAGGLWFIAIDQHGNELFAHYSSGTWTTAPSPINGLPGAVPGAVFFNLYGITWIPRTRSLWATGDCSYSDSHAGEHNFTVIFKYGT